MKYLLSLKIPIEGMDDPDAREKANRIGQYLREAIHHVGDEGVDCAPEYKLQKLHDNKPPEKMPWDFMENKI